MAVGRHSSALMEVRSRTRAIASVTRATANRCCQTRRSAFKLAASLFFPAKNYLSQTTTSRRRIHEANTYIDSRTICDRVNLSDSDRERSDDDCSDAKLVKRMG